MPAKNNGKPQRKAVKRSVTHNLRGKGNAVPINYSSVQNASNATGVTASLNEDLKTGIRFTGSGLSDFGMEAVVPLCNIGFPGAPANTSKRMANTTNFIDYFQVALSDVASHGYQISKAMDYIASMFQRWCPVKMEFIYRPTCPTTTVDRLVFGYNTDPDAVSIVAGASTITTADEAYYSILDNKFSIAFAPWESWRMPIDSKDLKSIKNSLLSTTENGFGGAASAASAMDRQTYAGILNVRSSILSGSSAFPSTQPASYGMLYLKIHATFFDICSVFAWPFTAIDSIPQNTTLVTVNGEKRVVLTDGTLIPVNDFLEAQTSKSLARSFPNLLPQTRFALNHLLREDGAKRREKEKREEAVIADAVRSVLLQCNSSGGPYVAPSEACAPIPRASSVQNDELFRRAQPLRSMPPDRTGDRDSSALYSHA